MRKVMVFGGSFDPFHHGHAEVIRALLRHCDHLLVVPCGERTDKKLSSPPIRLRMLQAGLTSLNTKAVSIINWQINEGHIYTRTLMQRLRGEYPKDQLFFVIGSDLISDIIDTWVLGKELLQESHFAVVMRKGHEVKSLPAVFSKESQTLTMEGLPELSSTFIRNEVKQGRDVGQWMPQSVAEIVAASKLYLE